MVKLPKEKFVTGDGWSASYVFNDRNYTTGYDIASQIRKKPTLTLDAGISPLATPTIQSSFADGNTTVVLSLTHTQTRDIGKSSWLDIQVTPSGGEPLTIVQQELEAVGDVTKP